jgi:hypothetical protein
LSAIRRHGVNADLPQFKPRFPEAFTQGFAQSSFCNSEAPRCIHTDEVSIMRPLADFLKRNGIHLH